MMFLNWEWPAMAEKPLITRNWRPYNLPAIGCHPVSFASS
jgi:hypothetical protein